MKKEKGKMFVAYFRVSTQKQGRSGLGLEAQREAIGCCLEGGEVIGEFVEVESGSKRNRPELAKALALCKETGAELIIAKLDRLSRDVRTIFELMDSAVKIKACDLPEFNTLTLGIFAAFAQYERERISERTAGALQAKRTRDGEWRKSNLSPETRARAIETNKRKARENENNRRALSLLASLEGRKMTLQALADTLNENGFRTAQGKGFTPHAVRLLRMRLEKNTTVQI